MARIMIDNKRNELRIMLATDDKFLEITNFTEYEYVSKIDSDEQLLTLMFFPPEHKSDVLIGPEDAIVTLKQTETDTGNDCLTAKCYDKYGNAYSIQDLKEVGINRDIEGISGQAWIKVQYPIVKLGYYID